MVRNKYLDIFVMGNCLCHSPTEVLNSVDLERGDLRGREILFTSLVSFSPCSSLLSTDRSHCFLNESPVGAQMPF